MKNNFFGKNFSDYQKLASHSLGHVLVPMFPHNKSLHDLLVYNNLPKYLQTILVQSLRDYYNVEFCQDIKKSDLALFELVEFQYHYQFIFKKELLKLQHICESMLMLYKFIDEWKNEHITYSHNMIIVNKMFYVNNKL